MPRTMLTDEHWSRLKLILLDLNIYDKPNLRNILEAMLFRLRAGCPWRDIPECFGAHNTIFKTFRRWTKSNKLIKLFKNLIDSPDLEWIFIDGSHIRAHQHSTGAAMGQANYISKSVAGNSSKIHLAVDANGNPIEFIISDGTTHDVKLAPELVSLLDCDKTEFICADKGYDSDELRYKIKNRAIGANIPKKKNTKSSYNHMDWYLYKMRHLVENAFARLKHFRSIATRFDKLKESFEATVALACASIWIKL